MAHFDLQLFEADGHLNFDTRVDEKGFSSGISKLGGIAKGGLAVLGAQSLESLLLLPVCRRLH